MILLVTGGGAMSGLRERQDWMMKNLAEFCERDPHPIIEVSLAGDVTYANPAAREWFPDLLSKKEPHFLIADFVNIVAELRKDTSRPLARIVKNAHKAYDLRLHLVLEKERVRIHVADATLRVAEEEKSRQFELIADSIRDFMTLINSDYVYEAANNAYCSAHKLRREALIGKTVSQVWGEQIFKTLIKGHLEKCFAGQQTSYQLWIEFPNIGRRYLTVTYYPHRDESGKITHAAVMSHDITDEIGNEEKLRVSAKRDALQRMASGVILEIEEPIRSALSRLKGLGEKLSRSTKSDSDKISLAPEIKSGVAAVEDAAIRMRTVIDGLHSFCPEKNPVREPTNVNSIIEKILVRRGADIRIFAHVITDLGALPPIMARAEELDRVFEYLLMSAVHSFEKPGIDSQKITIESWQEDPWLKVGISDNGREIPLHEQEHIFEPFYVASSRQGKESRLGLCVCKNIVGSLGGSIEMQSEVGRGTQFIVSLPLGAQTSATSSAKNIVGPTASARRPYIVVIDDDPDVGSTIRNILGKEHDVTIFLGAKKALEFFRRKPVVDIIFCDLMMPEMSGMEFFAALEAGEPDMARRMVFLSGGLTSPQAEKFLKTVSNRRCGKPIGAAAINQLVKEILGSAN